MPRIGSLSCSRPPRARPRLSLLTSLAVSLAPLALAQSEQWLEYHTSSEPKGYRWLELSTNPPPNVALPKLSAGAHFGQWTNFFDAPQGRWLCLDRTRKSGPCDRLFVDGNGNGRLDDDPPITTTRRDESMAYFESVKLVFKGQDGPVSYHLATRFYQFDKERAQLLIGSGGWYEGTVTLAGKKHRVQLTDNNVNAAFHDFGADPEDSDRITLDPDQDGGFSRYLGRYLEVDGQLLALEVAPDGAFLKAKPAQGVTQGSVQIPAVVSAFTAVGDNGQFVREPVNGKLQLPAGSYRVLDWRIDRNDAQGTKWTLSGYGSTPGGQFEVTPTQTTSLHVGEPLYAALEVTESRTDLAFSLRLTGSLGETVEIMRAGQRPRAPQLQVAGTGFEATRNFEYG